MPTKEEIVTLRLNVLQLVGDLAGVSIEHAKRLVAIADNLGGWLDRYDKER